MPTKEEVWLYIKTIAASVLTRDELLEAYDEGRASAAADQTLTKKLGVAEILYYTGGAIVFFGIAILIGQNWSTLPFAAKILSTLGAGIGAYIVGFFLSKDERTETLSSAFYLIFALVTPIGLYIVLDNEGFDGASFGSQSLISGILLATVLLSYYALRKNIFVLFGILFTTWLYFALTSFMMAGYPYFQDWDFFEYRILVAGLAYALLAYAFSKTEQAPLSGFLYGFGVLGFMGAALALGGWEPNQNVFWELIYPGLVFGVLFLSVRIKSKAFLTFGTLFLMGYILKLTSEYFSSGLGWPLALVIAGLSLIAIGYMSFSIKNKYLSS